MTVDAVTYFENQSEEKAEYRHPSCYLCFLTCEFSGYGFLE
jgi:hypothetical protein